MIKKVARKPAFLYNFEIFVAFLFFFQICLFLKTDTNMEKTILCAICHANLDNIESNTELPCDKKHAFHSNCINQWIVEKTIADAECPICRQKIFKLKDVVISIAEEQQEGKNDNEAIQVEGRLQICDCLDVLAFVIKFFVVLCIIIGPLLLLLSIEFNDLFIFGIIFTGFFDGITIVMLFMFYFAKHCRRREFKCFNYNCIC